MNSNIPFIISVGCNTQHEEQILRVRERLKESFPDIRFTRSIITPAYGQKDDAPPYSNMLASGYTTMKEEELKMVLKEMEKKLGNTQKLREEGIVMMDLDLMKYNGEKRHLNDWQRPYIVTLLKYAYTLIICILSFIPIASLAQDKKQDAELLGKAVEYYQGGKYHECIITFEKLQKNYRLAPRHMAFLGYSYFKEREYEKAANYLAKGIPQLTAYAPKEQAVYLYSCGESLFHLGRYKESREFYDKAVPYTEGNDKGDVRYHTAFGLYMEGDNKEAALLFEEAIELYKKHAVNGDELHKARCRQAEIMLKGIKRTIPNN